MAKDDVGVKIILKTTDFTSAIKKANKETKILKKNLSALGKEVGNAFKTTGIVGTIALIKQATNTMIKASKKQTEYIESLHLLQTAYGEVDSSGEKLVKRMTDLAGTDPAVITKSLAKYRQLSSALGIAGNSANLMSENLVKMQNDIASLYDMDTEDVGKKLMSALTGETEAIKILGADVTTTALQQKAYNMGINESVTNMSQAEKTILRYLSVQDQLKNSQGDYANTIGTVANQTKIWNAQLSMLSRQIGAIFMPLLKSVLPLLNGILMAINTIIGTVLGFFGINDAVTSISNDFVDLGTSIETASTAAKEAKKSLRGFDKLNVINTPSKTGGSAGGGGIGGVNSKLLAQLKEYNDGLDNAKNKAIKIRNNILKWFGYTQEANGELKFSGNLLDKVKIGLVLIGGTIAVITPVIKTLHSINSLIGDKLFKNIKKTKKQIDDNTKASNSFFDTFNKNQTKIQTAIKGIIGIGMAGAGLYGIYEAFKKINEGTFEAKDGIMLLVSSIGLISGAIITVQSAVTLFGGVFTTTMAAATGGISLVLGAIAGLIGYLVSARTETETYEKTIASLNEKLEKNMEDTYATIGYVQNLRDKLSSLIDENGKVVGSHEEVEKALSNINRELGTEYKLTGDTITLNGKKIKSQDELTKSINSYIKKLEYEALLEISKEKFLETKKNQIKLQEEYNKLYDELNTTLTDNDIKDKDSFEKWKNRNSDKIKRLGELDGKIQTNQKQLDLYSEAFALASQGDFDSATKYITKTADTVSGSLENVFSNLRNDSQTLKDAIANNITSLDGLTASFTINGKLTSQTKQTIKDLKELQQTYGSALTRGDIVKKSSKTNITKRASGGFVDKGDIFIANEEKPELIGTINNKPAVANNDQIVEAISVGVARAILSTPRQTGKTVIEATGDTKGLLDFIKFKEKERERQYGL